MCTAEMEKDDERKKSGSEKRGHGDLVERRDDARKRRGKSIERRDVPDGCRSPWY